MGSTASYFLQLCHSKVMGESISPLSPLRLCEVGVPTAEALMMPWRSLFNACVPSTLGFGGRFLVKTMSVTPESARDRLEEDCCPLSASLQGRWGQNGDVYGSLYLHCPILTLRTQGTKHQQDLPLLMLTLEPGRCGACWVSPATCYSFPLSTRLWGRKSPCVTTLAHWGVMLPLLEG